MAKLQNASFQGLFSSEKTMQAQRYASTKMDYLVYNGYNNLIEQPKKLISDSTFKDAVTLGSIATDDNGISHRTVTVSVYSEDEAHPRAKIQQVFYSNDANKYVMNGSSVTSSISMHYDKDKDRLYAMVDGEEKSLGGNGGVPIGTIIAWPSANNPAEGVWLDCNGQSCANYSALVAVLGKSTVPDYRGRFLEGAATAGTAKEAGLPNIKGTINIGDFEPGDSSYAFSGAFYYGGRNYGGASAGGSYDHYAIFDASRCSSIYGTSNTVQPPSVTVRYLIKAA